MNILIFGATGVIGKEICNLFLEKKYCVYGITRNKVPSDYHKDINFVRWDVIGGQKIPDGISDIKFDSVCWAQGANINDSIYDFNADDNLDMYNANCLYILNSLSQIIKNKLLSEPAKLCVISSIWQNIARQDKLSYCITKAALQGMINSLSVDLAKDGHLINAILPGALDTKMTRKSLSQDQINKIQSSTYFDRLSNVKDVSNLVYFLCSSQNTSVNGQFINVDLGFSNARII